MSLTASATVEATVQVSVRVRRGEAGDLEEGAVRVLTNVEVVESVTLERIVGVDPTWNDVHVDAVAEVSLALTDGPSPEATAVAARLEDGFGVTDVATVDLRGGGDR